MDEYLSRENEQRLGVIPATDTLSLTLANTEYSWAVPSRVKRLIFKLRTQDGEISYGWVAGTRNITLPAGYVRDFSDVHLVGRTLYVSCDLAGKTLEIEYLT